MPEAFARPVPESVFEAGDSSGSSDDLRAENAPGLRFALSRKAAAIIILYGATLLLLMPGARWSINTHEMLYAQSAREMVASGNWIIPTLVGLPRVEKPPLTTWLIGLAIKLTHRDSEWVVRLPSVISALAAALIIAHFSARFFGVGTGLLAGLIQLSSLWVLIVGEEAVPDMLLCATVSGALCAFAQANVEGPMARDSRLRLRWLFYVSAGLAFLTKGPIGPVLIFFSACAFLTWEGSPERIRFFWSPSGISVFLACVLLWPLLAVQRYPPSAGIWITENLGRLTGSLGSSSPFVYLYTLPWFILPWLPAAAMGAFVIATRTRPLAPVWRLFGIWFFFGFATLSLSRYRLYYYLVPILPPISTLAAVGLLHFCSDDRYRTRLSRTVEVALVAIFCGGGILAAQRLLPSEMVGRASGVILFLAAGLLARLYFRVQGKAAAQLVILFSTFWIATTLAQTVIVRDLDPYAEQTRFARRVGKSVPADRTLLLMYLFPVWHEQMFFYLPPKLAWSTGLVQLREKLASDSKGEIYLLAPERLTRFMTPIAEVRIVQVSPFVNLVSHRPSRLALMIVERRPNESAARTMRGQTLPSITETDIFP
jgi:4-amino-4-deoxy-L-arabinose transferase-like glycosyltransferase